jgi:putative membrane protein
MKNPIFFAAAITSLLLAASCSNNAAPDSKKEAEKTNDAKIDSAKTADTVKETSSAMAGMKPDADFAVAAADGGMLEVELGKIASQKGVSSEIKKLGAMMVKDHSAANAQLKATAKDKKLSYPI